jgi:release factor glutamine methyltransferase
MPSPGGAHEHVTVAEMRRRLTRAFAHLDEPEADARVLLQAALGVDRSALMAASQCMLTPAQHVAIDAMAARRLRREPVAHIIGVREFWSLSIAVTADTLIPRPETEILVEAALALVPERAQPLRIADIGTGSGAILLALLHELPSAQGIAVDMSAEALAVARANAQRLSLAGRTTFVRADLATALAGPLDLLVSNPPYIASAELSGLAPEVGQHEPRLALDGGPDGLAAYRGLAAEAARLLGPAGHLLVEIGIAQAVAVQAVFRGCGLALARPPIRDLGGIERVLVFQPRSDALARA